MSVALTNGATKRMVLMVLILGMAASLAALLFTRGGDPAGLDGAVDILADDDRFDDAQDAGESFALVASLLFEEGQQCNADGADAARCDARFSAGGFAQAFAVDALSCAQPAIEQGRAALRDHLREVAAIQSGGDVPRIPDLPAC